MGKYLSAILIAAACIGQAQNLVQNPGFEEPEVFNGFVGFYAGQSVGGWIVSFGDVHLVGDHWWRTPEGDQSLDLDGGGNGGIYQDLSTVPGETYRLRFHMAGNLYAPPIVKPMTIHWNGNLVGHFYYDGAGQIFNDPIWDFHEVLGLLATSTSTRLEFTSLASPQGFGAAIDAVEVVPMTGRLITGTIELQDYEPAAVAGTVATISVRNLNSLSDLETHQVVLGANGSYSFTSGVANGSYDMVCEGPHWLRQLRGSVVVTGGSASGVDFSLLNGDAEKDNEVNLVDFGRVSAAFGSVDGDPNWDANCDLNGDEEVNLVDVSIVNANFGEAGDE